MSRPSDDGPLAVLSRIRAGRDRPSSEREGERCDLCAAPVDAGHGHLVDLERRWLRCACRPCYLLFVNGGSRLRAVPDRYLTFPGLHLSPAQWDAFQIPVSVVFFFVNSALGRVVALYPSPAGATESLLPLDAWAELTDGHPELTTMMPDVEALLLRGERGRPPDCYLVPIDACYELVGRLRTTWRGFDGGADAHAELAAFFERVHQRARPVTAS
jgi:hypothetical protein